MAFHNYTRTRCVIPAVKDQMGVGPPMQNRTCPGGRCNPAPSLCRQLHWFRSNHILALVKRCIHKRFAVSVLCNVHFTVSCKEINTWSGTLEFLGNFRHLDGSMIITVVALDPALACHNEQ